MRKFQTTSSGTHAIEVPSMEKPPYSAGQYPHSDRLAEFWGKKQKEYADHLKSLHPDPILIDRPQIPGTVFEAEIGYQCLSVTIWRDCTTDVYKLLPEEDRRLLLVTSSGKEDISFKYGVNTNNWTVEKYHPDRVVEMYCMKYFDSEEEAEDFVASASSEKHEERVWPFFGHAPGNYTNQCALCQVQMDRVDKLCFVCLQCAIKETNKILAGHQSAQKDIIKNSIKFLEWTGEHKDKYTYDVELDRWVGISNNIKTSIELYIEYLDHLKKNKS